LFVHVTEHIEVDLQVEDHELDFLADALVRVLHHGGDQVDQLHFLEVQVLLQVVLLFDFPIDHSQILRAYPLVQAGHRPLSDLLEQVAEACTVAPLSLRYGIGVVAEPGSVIIINDGVFLRVA